jgi:hypothetical protein
MEADEGKKSLRMKCSPVRIDTEYVCDHNVTCLSYRLEARDSNVDRDKLSLLLHLSIHSNFEEIKMYHKNM